MNDQHGLRTREWWRSRSTWALLGFLAIAGFFLLTEHRAHAFGALLFLLVLLCPLLHLFGHGDHGGPGDATGSRAEGGRER